MSSSIQDESTPSMPNANEQQQRVYNQATYERLENIFSMFWEKPEQLLAMITKQVKDYNRFEFDES